MTDRNRTTLPTPYQRPKIGDLAEFPNDSLSTAIDEVKLTPILGTSFALIGRRQHGYWRRISARFESTITLLGPSSDAAQYLTSAVSYRIGEPMPLPDPAEGVDPWIGARTKLAELGQRMAEVFADSMKNSEWMQSRSDGISIDLSTMRPRQVAALATEIDSAIRTLSTLGSAGDEKRRLQGASERLKQLKTSITDAQRLDLLHLLWIGELLWYTFTHDSHLPFSDDELSFIATVEEPGRPLGFPLSLTVDRSPKWITEHLVACDGAVPDGLDELGEFNAKLAAYLCRQWKQSYERASQLHSDDDQEVGESLKRGAPVWPFLISYTLDRQIEKELHKLCDAGTIGAFHVLAPFLGDRTGVDTTDIHLLWLMATYTEETSLNDEPKWSIVGYEDLQPEGPIVIRPRGAPLLLPPTGTLTLGEEHYRSIQPWMTVSSWEYLSLFILADNMPQWVDRMMSHSERRLCLISPRLDEWTKKIVVQDSLFGNKATAKGREIYAVAPGCAADESRWLRTVGVTVISQPDGLTQLGRYF